MMLAEQDLQAPHDAAEGRRKFLKYREEFGEPLRFFGVYDKPFPDEG
jgi:hypothetical protein